MRLKITFEGVDLKPSNKVMLPIPAALITVAELVVYLRETFGLPNDVVRQITLSLDGFNLTENSRVQDVLVHDDAVLVACSPPEESKIEVPVHQPDVKVSSAFQLPFAIGSKIRFVEEPTDYDRMNLTVETYATVEGVDTELWGESDPVIVFKDANGSWDTLRYCKMTQLTVLDESTENVTDSVVEVTKSESTQHKESISDSSELNNNTIQDLSICSMADGIADSVDSESSFIISHANKLPKNLPVLTENIIDPKGIAWRKRQRSKCLGALRRQIEWFVKSEGSLALSDLCARSRITDITEEEDDVLEAVQLSKLVALRDGRVVIVPSLGEISEDGYPEAMQGICQTSEMDDIVVPTADHSDVGHDDQKIVDTSLAEQIHDDRLINEMDEVCHPDEISVELCPTDGIADITCSTEEMIDIGPPSEQNEVQICECSNIPNA